MVQHDLVLWLNKLISSIGGIGMFGHSAEMGGERGASSVAKCNSFLELYIWLPCLSCMRFVLCQCTCIKPFTSLFFLHRMNCQDQVVLLATLAHPPKCNPIQPLVVKWLLHQRSLLICIGGEMVTTSTESTYMQICIHTYYYYYYYYYYYHYGN